MFCGFMVLRSKMGWLVFLYWANPAAWAIGSLAQNEFFAARYDFVPPPPPPSNASIPAYANLTLGQVDLVLFDQQLDPVYKWAGVGFVIGSILCVTALSFWAFAVIRYDRNIGSARMLDDGPPPGDALALSVSTRSPTGGKVSASGWGLRGASRGDLAAAAGGGGSKGDLAESASALHLGAAVTLRDTSALPVVTASSVLPFTPLALAWRDVTYTVQLSKQAGGGYKQLLQGISGYAMPGRLIALMGARCVRGVCPLSPSLVHPLNHHPLRSLKKFAAAQARRRSWMCWAGARTRAR